MKRLLVLIAFAGALTAQAQPQGTCRLKGSPTSMEVTMRLYVAGFNHKPKWGLQGAQVGGGPVNGAGIQELVEFIANEPGPKDNIVVAISGSDPADYVCDPGPFIYKSGASANVPRNGDCFANALQTKFGGKWSIAQDYRDGWNGGGYALVVGPRFKVAGKFQSNIGKTGGVQTSFLRAIIADTKAAPDGTLDQFVIDVTHTGGGGEAYVSLTDLVNFEHGAPIAVTQVAPLFVGDFNESVSCPGQPRVFDKLKITETRPALWANHEVTCCADERCDQGTHTFDLDHQMQVFSGLLDGGKPFSCARGRLVPVTLSFTMKDGQVDLCNGAKLEDIGHNVIALGLGLDRNTPLHCAANESCRGNRCVQNAQGTQGCPAGKSKCGNRCVDKHKDKENCGKCDKRCASNQFCDEGKCESAN